MALGEQDWAGVKYRCSIVGMDYGEMVNTSHVDQGVLRRRPGFLRFNPGSGSVAAPHFVTIPFNNSIIAQSLTGITGINVSTTTCTNLSASVTSGLIGTFAKTNGRVYYSNGTDGPYVFDSDTSTPRTPGIPAPAGTIGPGTISGSGGKITAGSHIYRYRFMNATTGYVSNPSGALAITNAANDSISFSIGTVGTDIIRSATTGVDTIILEVTLQNGSSFYQGASVANSASSVSFALSDASLSGQLPVGLQYGDDGNLPMPAFDMIAEHRGRLFGYQNSSQLLGWSRPAFPESWDITRYARKLSVLDTTDIPTALVSYLGDLYIFTKYHTFRYIYVNDPSQGTVLPVPTVEGLWNPRCAVSVEGQMYGFGANGCWMINGISPQHISTDIDPFIEANLDTSNVKYAFGWYSQRDRSVTWVFVPQSTTSYQLLGITFNMRTRTWETREYQHLLRAAQYAFTNVYYSSDDGHFWTEASGMGDGSQPTITATVASGTTTSTINTVETMSDYVGANLVINIGGTYYSRIITAYTANSLTVGTVFPSIPTTGTVGAVGAINVRLTSEWRTYPELAKLSSPVYLVISFEPAQATLYHQVSYGINFTGYQQFLQGPGDTPSSGIVYSGSGATYVNVQSDGGVGLGYVPVPIDTQYLRTIRWHFDTWAPVSPFGLLELELKGREQADETKGIGE